MSVSFTVLMPAFFRLRLLSHFSLLMSNKNLTVEGAGSGVGQHFMGG